MTTIKTIILTTKEQGALIKDNRDDCYYLDDEPGMIRNFETLISEKIHKDDIVDTVAQYAGVSHDDIELIY